MIGAMLLVAAMTSQHSYTVKAGDTLSSIGASVGEPWQELCADNHIADCNTIYAGQTLSIPVAGEYVPPAGNESSGGNQHSSPDESQAPAPVVNSSPAGGIPGWATCIIQRESGGNPNAVNSVPGYIGNGGGLFGDLTSTWGGYDGYAQPFDAPVSVQVQFNDQLSGNGANLAPWAADHCPGT